MAIGIKALGIFAIVPATVLLTISFFVLVIVRKVEEEGLKSFGRIIAMLLWVAAILVFITGLYVMATGNCPMINMMGECGMSKMCGKSMHEYMGPPMEGKMHKGMLRK